MPAPDVLIAEPDPDLALHYTDAYESVGYAVRVARDGGEALERALVAPPKLVVAELRLRRIDGAALCATLRRDAATRTVPLILIGAPSQAVSIDREGSICDAPHRRRRRGTISTIHPPTAPPPVHCSVCDTLLVYQKSHFGGVKSDAQERWDEYDCSKGHGAFVFRHRTGKLRRAF
jgi:CheY-like chemotaxis protein